MIHPAPQLDALVGRMGSLAEPIRLRLLRLLERHELGVIELCQVLQLPQSTVSRHLKVLADQGWLHSRRLGTTNLYRMDLDEIESGAKNLWTLAREQTRDWATAHQDELRLIRRLRDRKGTAEAFFAGAAGEWEKLRGELYGQRFNHEAMLALLPPRWTVADLGCGAGDLTLALAGHVHKVIGIDQSSAMLKAARTRTQGLSNVELHQGDLESIPLPDDSCDAALLVLVLTYVSRPPAVLKEMARIVRPGGRAVVVDLLRHDRDDFRRRMGQQSIGFETAEITRLLTQAGLVEVASRALTPEPQTTGPALLLASASRALRKTD